MSLVFSFLLEWGADDFYRVADNYIKPFKENVIRFDFEVPEGDEHLVGVLPMLGNGKK